jgi:hypothetical protein
MQVKRCHSNAGSDPRGYSNVERPSRCDLLHNRITRAFWVQNMLHVKQFRPRCCDSPLNSGFKASRRGDIAEIHCEMRVVELQDWLFVKRCGHLERQLIMNGVSSSNVSGPCETDLQPSFLVRFLNRLQAPIHVHFAENIVHVILHCVDRDG